MYKLTNNGLVIRLSDNASIPATDSNADFQEFIYQCKRRQIVVDYFNGHYDFMPDEIFLFSADPLPQPTAESVKSFRDNLLQTGGCKVTVDTVDYWFHSDLASKVQQLALVTMGASLPVGLMWKTMSSAFVEMTPTLAQQIFLAQVTREMQIFAHGEALIAQVPGLTWEQLGQGWPDKYV